MAVGAIGPGAVLGGRYRLDEPLSETAGAEEAAPGPSFWRGTDAVLGRTVAIHAVLADDPRAEGLVDAARASATVTDPHLLRVLDCDDHDGVVWVVNEWAEGATLASVLQGGPLAPERAARLTREVAEALASAHSAGVAHGRLTPEAVLLTDAGTVRLIGFAVTASLEGAASDEPGLDDRGYGRPDPVQADVIDLAALLYAGLTGRWPGIAPSTLPQAPGDARGPLRPRQVRAGVPRMLDTLCERVLRREAHEQVLPIETAQEVLAALTDEVGDQATGVLDAVDGAEALAVGVPEARVGVRTGTHSRHGWTGQPRGEETVALRSEAVSDPTDPDATQAVPTPAWASGAGGHTAGAGGEAPSLPPYQDPPDRPLFAGTDRRPRDPGRGSSAWLYGDAATGTLDPVVAPPGGGRRRAGPGRGWSWGRVAALVAVIAVLVAMAVAFELGRGSSPDRRVARQPSSSASATPTDVVLKPAHVSDFDPDGNPTSENPDEVPRATDGKASTGWTTMTYTRPALGGLKPGVGLLVDLGSDRAVGSVDLVLGGTPTDLALYASPRGASTAPTNVTGMRRVAVTKNAGRTVTLRPGSVVRTRYLVVWLTSLPRVSGGYRGEIDELTVRG